MPHERDQLQLSQVADLNESKSGRVFHRNGLLIERTFNGMVVKSTEGIWYVEPVVVRVKVVVEPSRFVKGAMKCILPCIHNDTFKRQRYKQGAVATLDPCYSQSPKHLYGRNTPPVQPIGEPRSESMKDFHAAGHAHCRDD